MSIEAAKLQGSLLLFTKVFFKLRTGAEFIIDQDMARESHYITVSKALTKTQRGESKRLIINIPPRYGKTELAIHYIAWCMARYPKSNFLYISYSHSLAKKQTQIIRQIMTMPLYRQLFGVEISPDSSAKDNFETTVGGSVYAAGAGGTIMGRGAGLQNTNEFGGAIFIDDIHKPIEVTSDTMRESILDWYKNTLQSRLNNPSRTPIIFIGQRLHEDDLGGNLLNSYDGHQWDPVILPALDKAGNALCPRLHTREQLLAMEKAMPYVAAAQMQQNPQPAGGGIFKPDWFVRLEEDPKILFTFITVDSAETEKTYNDATVFSFWGIYKIEQFGIQSDQLGLHWIDCHQCWVEPKDLQGAFLQFYRECMQYPVKPGIAGIEKKSTGVTLTSILKEMPGLQILEIERDRSSGNKADRFINTQRFVAEKRVSFNIYAKHVGMCIEHMKKITANNTHRYDDIADTYVDAALLAFIDQSLTYRYTQSEQNSQFGNAITAHNARIREARLRQRI